MPDSKDDGLVRSVENLLAEKQAIAAKEKQLIEDLNVMLGKMGYRVVSTRTGVHVAGAGGIKKAGRPPGTGKGLAAKASTAG